MVELRSKLDKTLQTLCSLNRDFRDFRIESAAKLAEETKRREGAEQDLSSTKTKAKREKGELLQKLKEAQLERAQMVGELESARKYDVNTEVLLRNERSLVQELKEKNEVLTKFAESAKARIQGIPSLPEVEEA